MLILYYLLTTFSKGYNEVSVKWIRFGITFLTEGSVS